MTERRRVYYKVLAALKKIIKGQKQGHVTTLAMMIAGIVLGHKAQLSAMSSEVPYPAKDTSIEMRMRRWVKNEHVDVEVTYMPFARQILEALSSSGPLVLAMDGSTIGRGCMVLMVGVIYQKRALPVAWVVYKGKKGHTTAARHVEVLKKVLPLIPEGAEVVLLGDAEYDTVEMLEWVLNETDWSFVMRTGPNIQFRKGNSWQAISTLTPSRAGRIKTACDVRFTKTAALKLNVVAWWGLDYEAPIFLVTNLPNGSLAAWFYKRRFKIETFFSDQKSRGFYIHKSHLSDPARLSRLLIAACLAYVWMIVLGLLVVSRGQTGLIGRTDRIDKSVFRLGLDWLRYVLKRELHFEVYLLFQLPRPSLALGDGNVR